MGVQVIALDSEETLTQTAERILHELNCSSVEVVLGPLADGWEKEAPYEKMIIEGCIDTSEKGQGRNYEGDFDNDS